jgi:hypothetical protein
MTYDFEFGNGIGRFRAPLFAALILILASCNSTDSFTPAGTDDPTAIDGSLPDVASLSTAYAGGIPFGHFRLPTSELGSRYNGITRNIDPNNLRDELAAIKSRGGKIALALAGPERYYKDSNGHFSFTKWKARLDRYKDINFSSYVTDGTVIGNFLIDEPQDPKNWNNQPISPSTLEAMAKYSKQRWPGMVTIVRTWPDYLDNWSGTYYYLDAAWAQYAANRWPNVYDFLTSNVAKAKAKGLALIVGMNILYGSPTREAMSANQIRYYGSALLSSSYPCAFISWMYADWYMSKSSIKDAMSYLRSKAQGRNFKSCRS